MIDKQVLEKLEFEKILKHISNYASTEPGKKQILDLIPVYNLKVIEREGLAVQEAKDLLIKFNNPPIDYLPFLEESLHQSRIEGAMLSNKKILDIAKLAKCSRLLFQFINKESDNYPILKDSSSNLYSDKVFEHHIEKIINEEGEVKENASSTLSKIRKDIRSKKDELVKSINRIIKSLKEDDLVREEYLTLRDGRMVVPVKSEHKRHIRGFIHSESSTGQTVYIEPEETLELNNDIVSLSFAEKREIERLLRELTKLIGQKSGELLSSLLNISYIDSIFARAKYSIEIIGCLPEINSIKSLQISEARHPLLIKKLGRNNTVPLNFKLKDEKVIIITGPNAGGKTVVLKTLGILALMLQSGIHIPVNPDSNFKIFKNILVDIGDEQSLEDDLSTFSSHLKNLNKILIEADNKSLVLLDEIGTGTDPSEGSALAASILMELLQKNSIVFASTHHGSLKLFAYNVEGMMNAAMQFDHSTLSPTYIFKLGSPGSSYAFQIAERTGLPAKILDDAKNNLDADKHNLEKFISEVEEKSSELEKKLKQLEKENLRLEGLSNLYKKSYEKIENEKRDIIKKARLDAQEYLNDINKKLEAAIKQVRESAGDKNQIKTARKIVDDIKVEHKHFEEAEEIKSVSQRDLNVGDYVMLIDSQTKGKIVEMIPDKKRAIVLSGNVKMQVQLKNLILTKETVITDDKVYHNFQVNQSADYRIDIRGEKPEEAEFEVIKFLDNAYQSGLERVEILHGKGTGALKKTVQIILKGHEKVKNYYFAPIEYGGDGITIVEMR